jgi:hypothetical protein
VIAPASGIHDDRVSAAIVAAVDQQPARAGLAHLALHDHDNVAKSGCKLSISRDENGATLRRVVER